MGKPHFTILVPTRDRAETLFYTLKTCINQNYDNYEVIVSDNFSSDNTKAVVDEYSNHDQIRYINPGRRLSMTGNFEFALSHVETEGFVISIGDDDGLMAGALERAAELIREYEVLALANSSIYYAWPNFPIKEKRNTIFIHDKTKRVEVRNGKEEIKKIIAFTGREKNYVWGLPGLYRGFVHTSVLNKVKGGGRYFNSITPDAYSAFANALFLDRYLFTTEPLTIEGVSGKSNGASQILGVSKDEEKKYLAENDIEFHEKLVYSPTPSIVLAECFLKVQDTLPDQALDLNLDFQRLCESALKSATGINANRITASVKKIREINNLPETTRKANPLDSVMLAMETIIRTYFSVFLDCEKAGIKNVYDASLIFQKGYVDNVAIKKSGLGLIIKNIIRKLKSGENRS